MLVSNSCLFLYIASTLWTPLSCGIWFALTCTRFINDGYRWGASTKIIVEETICPNSRTRIIKWCGASTLIRNHEELIEPISTSYGLEHVNCLEACQTKNSYSISSSIWAQVLGLNRGGERVGLRWIPIRSTCRLILIFSYHLLT